MTNNITQIYVGVDISKDFLDVHLYPIEKDLRIVNSKQGLDKLLKIMARYNIFQVVCESSGGYESKMIKILKENNYRVWQVQPRRIRAFIISEGVKTKTDKIDARMIALFASAKEQKYQQASPPQLEERLRSLMQYRTNLVKTIGQENNKLQHPQQTYCAVLLKDHIAFMQKQLEFVEKEINALIEENKSLQDKAKIIESMPGVGKITAHSLIAHVPELGTIDNKQIAAIVGVAPFVRQSGKSKGNASIYGGRSEVRAVLYMAALTASRFNLKFKLFYKKLRDSGKSAKVALVAIMRKIIVIVNTMLRKDKLWQLDF